MVQNKEELYSQLKDISFCIRRLTLTTNKELRAATNIFNNVSDKLDNLDNLTNISDELQNLTSVPSKLDNLATVLTKPEEMSPFENRIVHLENKSFKLNIVIET